MSALESNKRAIVDKPRHFKPLPNRPTPFSLDYQKTPTGGLLSLVWQFIMNRLTLEQIRRMGPKRDYRCSRFS
ncbi:hypothetical protein TNCV_4870281 [Trichonephila clavipes]|nr:hypothetical protein TNCV_4870281 [Trichonephila clavipes]